MSGRADEDVAGAHLALGAVVHADAHPARDDVAVVVDAATVGARDGCHRLRPAPARFEGGDGEVESAEVHGNYYGTPRAQVEEQLAAGKDILFDVDYQGTLQLYENCRADMVTVFILPPTIQELRARLERRAQDSVGTIEKRLRNARIELDHAGEYDYVIINSDLESSVQRVRSILASARLKRERQLDLMSFVQDLQSQIDALGPSD